MPDLRSRRPRSDFSDPESAMRGDARTKGQRGCQAPRRCARRCHAWSDRHLSAEGLGHGIRGRGRTGNSSRTAAQDFGKCSGASPGLIEARGQVAKVTGRFASRFDRSPAEGGGARWGTAPARRGMTQDFRMTGSRVPLPLEGRRFSLPSWLRRRVSPNPDTDPGHFDRERFPSGPCNIGRLAVLARSRLSSP